MWIFEICFVGLLLKWKICSNGLELRLVWYINIGWFWSIIFLRSFKDLLVLFMILGLYFCKNGIYVFGNIVWW